MQRCVTATKRRVKPFAKIERIRSNDKHPNLAVWEWGGGTSSYPRPWCWGQALSSCGLHAARKWLWAQQGGSPRPGAVVPCATGREPGEQSIVGSRGVYRMAQ